jgi:GAF domain-containing protein
MFSTLSTAFDQFITPRYRYMDPMDRLRARLLMILCLFGVVSAVTPLIIALVSQTALSALPSFIPFLLLAGLGLFAGLATLVNNGQVRLASALLITFQAVGTSAAILTNSDYYLIALMLIPLVCGGLLYGWRGALSIYGLSLIVLVLRYQRGFDATLPFESVDPVDLIPYVQIFTFVTLPLVVLSVDIQRFIRSVVNLRTQLRIGSELAQTSAGASSLADLTVRVVNYLRDRFAFYHVQLFLIDREKRYVDLVSGTGEAGQVLLKRGYRLSLNSQSTITQVLSSGEAIIVPAGRTDPLTQQMNELLPQTRSELLLPLIVGDEVIGVLDIHSTRTDAFRPEDVDNLRLLVSNVSVAVRQQQRFEEQREVLNETRRLFLEAETNLRENQRVNQRLTGQAWQSFLRLRGADSMGFTLENNQIRPDATWTNTLEQAAQRKRSVVAEQGERQIVAVPVELRGQPIGAIEVEIDDSARQNDALEMLQSVAQRLALSIDNARLFEQAQDLAQREREVNAISVRLQAASDMEDLARTALQELSRALGAQSASIRLGVE